MLTKQAPHFQGKKNSCPELNLVRWNTVYIKDTWYSLSNKT